MWIFVSSRNKAMLEFIEVVPSQSRINFSCVDDIVVFLNKTFSVVDTYVFYCTHGTLLKPLIIVPYFFLYNNKLAI